MAALVKTMKIALYRIEAPLGVRIARAAESKIEVSEFIQLTEEFETKMLQDNRLTFTRTFVNNYKTIEEFH